MDVLAAFLAGATDGSAPGMVIEGPLLIAADEDDATLVAALGACLAIRVDADTVLVRLDLPAPLEDARATLEERLAAGGLTLIERDAAVATVVGIELAGLRGSAWSLWATDPERGRAALERAAAGELADQLDRSGAETQAAVEAALAALEDDLRT